MAQQTNEIGTTGLIEFSGRIAEDFLVELRGQDAVKKYNEMRLNSPVIGALLLAIEHSIRSVKWQFTSEAGENDPRLELLNASLAAMTHNLNDHVIEALTMLPFGFSIFEIVYQRVDGRLVWRKFAPRGQNTVYQWLRDDSGGLAGFIQQTTPLYKPITIPIERMILYRTRIDKGNPEGRSILRTAWTSYYFAKHIMQVEAIGIERDLAGMPKVTLPAGADTSGDENDESTDFGRAVALVRRVRNDEQAGIVIPEGWDFDLVSTGGSRQFDTDKIVNRYESRMLMSALAQFLLLGQNKVGSQSLSKDQTDFFTMSVNAMADILAETLTKYALPRLLKLNGYTADGIKIEHTPAGDVDLTSLSDFLQKIGDRLTWTAQDEVWLRQIGKLPQLSPEEIQAEKERRVQQQMDLFREQAKARGNQQDQQQQDQKQQDQKNNGKQQPGQKQDGQMMKDGDQSKMRAEFMSTLDLVKAAIEQRI